jgi:hypothetical protein
MDNGVTCLNVAVYILVLFFKLYLNVVTQIKYCYESIFFEHSESKISTKFWLLFPSSGKDQTIVGVSCLFIL